MTPVEYVRHGWALCPIPAGKKGPVREGWNRRENAVTTPERAARLTQNVGLCHAWSGTCVLDLDDIKGARAYLADAHIDLRALFMDPRAVRLMSGRPNRAKLLFRLPEGVAPLQSKKVAAGALELRCATAKGTTVQDVLPPSIHPDTGKPYIWEYGDELVGDWRSPPVLPADVLAHWQSLIAAPAAPVEHERSADDARLVELLADHDPDATYEDWLRVGMALHHETEGAGFALWDEWSARGSKYPGSEKLMAHWSSFGHHPNPATLGSLRVEKPADVDDFDVVEVEPAAAGETEQDSESPLFRFYAYLPSHQYMDRHTRALWPSPSIDGHLKGIAIDGLKPSAWLDKFRAVDQMTWAPELPEIIRDRVVAEGGWLDRDGVQVYNTYLAPPVATGDPAQAAPWLRHLERVYPNDFAHMLKWFAHRVQHPGDKINHALVIGGGQGIGKETLLEPVKVAIGSWNWNEIAPHQMLGRFNGWCKSVVVRINEARDLGEIDRFAFYDRSKSYIAAPPDVIRIDEKHAREYYVPNVMGVIITTNDKLSGIYLPADDRRHYVAWSELDKAEFEEGYWNELWGWYKRGGFAHVAAYLHAYDLSAFDSKAPPPKTETFHRIVEAGDSPEDSDLATVLADMGDPDAVTVEQVRNACAMTEDDAIAAMFMPKARRSLPHKFERAGYETLRNPDERRGRWTVDGRQSIVYVRKKLQVRERLLAAQRLTEG